MTFNRVVGFSNKSEMLNLTFFNKAKIYIFEKPFKNGCNNMCHMLIFGQIKNNYFEHFYDILFELI